MGQGADEHAVVVPPEVGRGAHVLLQLLGHGEDVGQDAVGEQAAGQQGRHGRAGGEVVRGEELAQGGQVPGGAQVGGRGRGRACVVEGSGSVGGGVGEVGLQQGSGAGGGLGSGGGGRGDVVGDPGSDRQGVLRRGEGVVVREVLKWRRFEVSRDTQTHTHTYRWGEDHGVMGGRARARGRGDSKRWRTD